MRVWNGDQGSRSIRAGIRLRMAPGAVASGALVMGDPPTVRWRTGAPRLPPSARAMHPSVR